MAVQNHSQQRKNKTNQTLPCLPCKARKVSMSSLVTFSILTTLMVLLGLFKSFARVLYNRYDARWILKTKSENTIKWRNGGIINPLFDGLTYNMSGHFAHCSYSVPRPDGARKYTAQLAKYPRVLYVKPSNKVYVIPLIILILIDSIQQPS